MYTDQQAFQRLRDERVKRGRARIQWHLNTQRLVNMLTSTYNIPVQGLTENEARMEQTRNVMV